MTNPDKNKYKSNVLHWKQFLEGGEGQSTAAEPYDPGHACVVVTPAAPRARPRASC